MYKGIVLAEKAPDLVELDLVVHVPAAARTAFRDTFLAAKEAVGEHAGAVGSLSEDAANEVRALTGDVLSVL